MKKILSVFLSVVILMACIPSMNARATEDIQYPTSNFYARIRYAANGRYLDLPAEALYNNGTQLQVWDKVEGNQNQIFHFTNTGDGWIISSKISGKIMEVRNSSHDDYAQVAQWDMHDYACGRWYIIANEGETVSLQNKESGLYLNVCGGGDAKNGTKMIQYHNDGTIAMRFYLECITFDDIHSAVFKRQITQKDIRWIMYDFNTIIDNNKYKTKINGVDCIPAPNQKILESVEFIPPQVVLEILKEKAYKNSVWQEIEAVVKGEADEDLAEWLFEELDFDIPYIGYGIGVLHALLDMKKNRESNAFVDVVQYGCGVIAYTYYNVNGIITAPIPNANGSSGKKSFWRITGEYIVEYKTWAPENYKITKNIPEYASNGYWYINFK